MMPYSDLLSREHTNTITATNKFAIGACYKLINVVMVLMQRQRKNIFFLNSQGQTI